VRWDEQLATNPTLSLACWHRCSLLLLLFLRCCSSLRLRADFSLLFLFGLFLSASLCFRSLPPHSPRTSIRSSRDTRFQ